jgi:hypothetical protein
MIGAMRALTLLALLGLVGCGDGLSAVYPPRPPTTPGPPIADPAPSRIVIHTSISGRGLAQALNQQIPQTGSGSFPLLGSDRKYQWQRTSLVVSFASGKLQIQAQVMAKVSLPIADANLPINLRIAAEPVVSSEYQARLQAPVVEVTSADPRLQLAQSVGGALDKIRDQLASLIDEFRYDLRPIVNEAYSRVAKPIDLPLGDAKGCALLRVLGVEAAPTVLADGIEKDLALVVAPSVTLPCQAPETPPPLPALSNVASLPTGPFTVTVPIAARYEEMQKAMSLAFTDGKLYFSTDFPKLYLEKPEVYQHKDQLVVKLHLKGIAQKGSIKVNLDGDLYMMGRPTVVDNELRVPDLEPTIETSSFLLKLAVALNGSAIRDQARNALKLDIGDRLRKVREKVSSEISFGDAASAQGCVRAEVTRIEVNNVTPHSSYLRVYVQATGIASVHVPCPQTAAPPVPNAKL